jgi:hypothetical protein
MSDLNARVVRRSLRALALTPAVALPLVSAPAFAAPPEAWPTADSVSGLEFLLVLLIIPLGLAVVISVLATVPSLVGGNKRGSVETWREEKEWFGGPKDGVEATEKAEPGEGERGGASARW